jgi:hypothetical protein
MSKMSRQRETAKAIWLTAWSSDPKQKGGKKKTVCPLSELQDLEHRTCSEMRYLTALTLTCLQSEAEIQIRLW